MNARAVDHLAVMVINCAAIAGTVYLVMHDHPWFAIACLCFAMCRSSPDCNCGRSAALPGDSK